MLYLFGGTNYPESEECLEGLYAYDIGKICILVIRKPGWYLLNKNIIKFYFTDSPMY